MVKNPTSDCREGLQIEALTPEGPAPPANACGPWKLLVLLTGESFHEILAQPSLRTSQPAEIG